MTEPQERGTTLELSRQLVLLLTNVTVIAALLIYFGWQRAEVQNRELGFDQALLGMSTQDYLLRSVDQILLLLAVVGVAGLGFVWIDRRLSAAVVSKRPIAKAIPWSVAAIALLLPIGFAVSKPFWTGVTYTLWPLSVAAGVLLLLFSAKLSALLHNRDSTPSAMTQVCAILVTGVCLFTAASHRAEVLGTELAAGFVRNLPLALSVTVTSDKPLYLAGPGVGVEQLDPDTYRYTGLKLMEQSNGKNFLLPQGWSPGHGQLIVLTEEAGLRFSYGDAVRP